VTPSGESLPQRCPACGWHGVAHVYNLVWTWEWACPGCASLHPARATTRRAVLARLEERARLGGDLGRAERARSLAAAFTGVLGRRAPTASEDALTSR